MNEASGTSAPSRHGYRAALGLLALAAVALPPLLVERPPLTWALPPASALAAWGSKGLVLLAMGGIVVWRWRLDRKDEPLAAWVALGLVLAAGLMTLCHWLVVDQTAHAWDWQRHMYLDILNHAKEEGTHALRAPHQFRPLPYGFVRSLELLTGDWWFACVAYRWFFNYWFLWAWYRFARLYLPWRWALLTLVPLPFLYPLSIWYYLGQLTDPVSHALFVLALVWVVEDRWLALAGALALGVLAKETAVLLVPAYWACRCWEGFPPLLKAFALGVVCVAAYLAVRLPLGWWPGYESINGTEGLMIATNLGIGRGLYYGAASTYQNYLHPLLFVGPFLVPIVFGCRRLDRRLLVLCLTLTPLLLLSNLCFGWLYESRNYMPLVPLLATAAFLPRRRVQETQIAPRLPGGVCQTPGKPGAI